jgi:two-component system sensor histidine kinase RpfC
MKELFVRLRGRPDSEHEMSFNRVAFGVAVLIAVLAANPNPGAVGMLIAYCVGSVIVFFQIARDSAVRPVRRLAVMAVDFIVLSYVMHANDAYAAAAWPIYLWVIFGNGFRFGLTYLFAASATAIICFGVVVATTPFWRDMLSLSIGLMVGMLALPAYAGQLIRKISTARREAEEASRAKSYFLASVSHELRTPLTAIIGLGAHLQDTNLTPDQKGMTATIVTAGRSLLGLINQLLDFSRLGVDGRTAKAEPFDLLHLILSVREMLEVTAEDKGLKIGVHIDASTPLSLMGDEPHLRDILVNLVGNAIKFTEKGSITISASSEKSVSGELVLRFAVQDTGIGIVPEAQEHIFESFRQADNTIIDRFGGTGLGLAICKQLASLLGGEIGVESVPGEGSRFWFTAQVRSIENASAPQQQEGMELLLLCHDTAATGRLKDTLVNGGIRLVPLFSPAELAAAVKDMKHSPSAVLIDSAALDLWKLSPADVVKLTAGCAPAILLSDLPASAESERCFATRIGLNASAEETVAAVQIANAAGRRLVDLVEKAPDPAISRSLRVLVADDNAMNQKVFGMILSHAGHSVESALDGESALDLMRDRPFDVVLMDVNMPVLNGVEATKLFRFSSLGRKHLPIIGVTADASPETSQRCLEAGMDACVSKPIEGAALLKVIGEVTEEISGPIEIHDPKGVVTSLFPSKTANSDGVPALNWATLKDLEELGGREFVAELLTDYLSDAANLIDAMSAAIDAGNSKSFRDGAHAFRSSAANIGADRLAELCQKLQHIEQAEFDGEAPAHLDTVKHEIELVRQALDAGSADYAPRRGAVG